MTGNSIALIPARGGSKGIPRKNLQLVGGVPLLVRTIKTAKLAGIQKVFVSTDNSDIANMAKNSGAEIIVRPPELATDEAPTNSVLEHAYMHLSQLGYKDFNPFYLLQCTSPFLLPTTLIKMYERSDFTSPFLRLTTYDWHGIIWEQSKEQIIPIGHSLTSRNRRQDSPLKVLETGAAYLSRLGDVSCNSNRVMRKNYSFKTTYLESLQIDTPEDLEFCDLLANLGNI